MTDSNELIGAVRGVIVGAAGQAITIREGVGEVAERITAASDALTWRVEATSTFTGSSTCSSRICGACRGGSSCCTTSSSAGTRR